MNPRVYSIINAIQIDDLDSVEWILKHLNYAITTLYAGETPLRFAARKNHYRSIPVLLRYGADIEKMDSDGFTPLMIAANNGAVESVRMLLDLGAKIDTVSEKTGCSALLDAVSANSPACVSLLLERGADQEGAKDFAAAVRYTKIVDLINSFNENRQLDEAISGGYKLEEVSF